ncbi:MAG: DUF4249 domain-containing protein [Aquaticitalea sp.]
MRLLKTNFIFLIVIATTLYACTESYEIKTKTTENLLVVEATITDELKFQEIKLSKTYELESNEPNLVSNAQVWVQTDNGTQHNFAMTEPGLYISVDMFQAQAGQNYTLHARLSDGTTYVSTTELLPSPSQIESLEPVLQTVDGEEGVQILVNSSGGSDAVYFKYDYVETYKTIVPFYDALDLRLTNVSSVNGVYYELELVEKENDVSTCYTSLKSTDIIQTSLNETDNSAVTEFPVRFIKTDNGIIRDRYSILVTQQVQSLEAYNFYKILNELGSVDNVFNNIQPGFIQGNLSNVNNPEENVIGFFQVTSVSTKRVYFNYTDFGIAKPPYIFECIFQEDVDYNDNTGMDGDRNDYIFIYNVLRNASYNYYDGDFPVYTLVTAQCADCTTFSSTIIPEFWEE